jgi:hypothetical protein
MQEQKIAPLFTTKFTHGRRTFFFDIKKAKNDKPYLKITEASLRGEEKKRAFLTVFDNEVQEFCQAIADATGFILKPN